MVKKLLFISFLFFSILGFSQKSLEKLSAAPNPFKSLTYIHFESKSEQPIILTVKNVLGKSIFKKQYTAKKGANKIVFYRNNLRSGIYIYLIQSNKEILSKRFVIR